MVCGMQIIWNAMYVEFELCGILEENGDEEAAHLRPLCRGMNRVLRSASGIVNKALTKLQRELSTKEANYQPIAEGLQLNKSQICADKQYIIKKLCCCHFFV
jgi:hypothetical protein